MRGTFFLTGIVLLLFETVIAADIDASPNLLIVYPDQMRGQAMGFLGQEPVITPHLDRFATEALVLTEAVANYPVCSPSRAMLMSGCFPHANGVLSNCNSHSARFGYELAESTVCWSDVLKRNGYSLGYIGKWHLDSPHQPFVESYNNRGKFAWNEWCPPKRRHGFDFWYAYGTFDLHLTPEYWSTHMKRHERVKVKQWGPEHEADLAIKYLQNADGTYRKPGEPFALVVAMNPPHMPYDQVPRKYVDLYRHKTSEELITRRNVKLDEKTRGARLAKKHTKENYFAMITGVDEQFGRILAALDAQGLREDTIVLFTSDHGNCLGSHDEVSKNVHYDESMRVPFLVRWPGKIKPRHDDLLLSTTDISPTLLDLMGFDREIPQKTQGKSHAELFLTGKGPRPTSALYLFAPVGKPAMGRRGVRTHHYTLVLEKMPSGTLRHVLHDNVEDPYQLRNISEKRQEIVQQLIRDELIPWLRRTNDPWLTESGLAP